jgi:ABC-type multidrug transport system ATPase subunit
MQVGYGTAKAGALIRIGTNDGSRGRYATWTAEGGRPHICKRWSVVLQKKWEILRVFAWLLLQVDYSSYLVTTSTSNSSTAVSVHNVVKQFGRFAALRGVTAEFDAGRFHAILGDNGAGKTTLLRAVAGLAQPTHGTISIFGKSPRSASRELGYMAHPSLLYDEMTGMENLRYVARLYGIAGDGRCEAAIRAVGLDPALSRGIGQYSQGMRQRMSLARAILHDPKILLLDEPFSNVDVHSAREMVGLLKGMRVAGKTIFVVTHQALLLEDVADEFIWMRAGQIVDRTATIDPAMHGSVQ